MLGYTQPTFGQAAPLGFVPMPALKGPGSGKGGHKPKGTKKLVSSHARDLRNVLARNLRVAIDAEWPPRPTQPENSDGIAALAAAAGCSISTIQRILAADVSPRVDQIADLAAPLGLKALQLLDRHFALPGRETEVDPGRELYRARG